MAATTLLFADNASTTLAASITAGATSCTLAPGTGALFPNPGANQAFAMSFVDAATGLVTEIVKVTATSGDTITTMARGQEGTAARAWLAGDLASNLWTAGALGAGAMAQTGPLQQGSYGYAVDSGSANTIVITLAPAIPAYVDGLPINFKAAANNTGATTINVNGLGALALQGAAGALQGGEIVAGKMYEANYNTTSNTFVILGQGGGAEQISPATASQHAVQFAQVSGVAGQVRNLKMYVSAASSTATITADEIIVETALGGLRYCLPSVSLPINLATTGAGGMDTGSAPVNGYAGIYAIWNPNAAVSGTNPTTVSVNTGASILPTIYGSGHMPAGYTASALVAMVTTNGSGQIAPVLVRDRLHSFPLKTALSTSTIQGTVVSLGISGIAPPNAISIGGEMGLASSTSSTAALTVAADSNVIAQQNVTSTVTTTGYISNFNRLPLASQQTVYWGSANSAGTPAFTLYISSYDI